MLITDYSLFEQELIYKFKMKINAPHLMLPNSEVIEL